MVTFREALENTSKAALCSVLAGGEAAAWLGVAVTGGNAPDVVADEIRKLRLTSCDNPDSDVDIPEGDFTGGQCDTLYRVFITVRDDASGVIVLGPERAAENQNASNNANIWTGPIEGIRIGQVVSSPARYGWILQHDGIETVGTLSYPSSTLSATIDRVERVDGLPDDCGDIPPPPIPPYSPVTINKTIIFNDNSNTEITEEGDFNILAPVIIGGNLIAPITVNVGGIDIPVRVNLSTGDISINFDFSDTPSEVQPPEVDNPTEDEPQVEEDTLFYGLVVYSTPTGQGRNAATIVGQVSAPSVLLPRTGNVWFQIPVGDRVTWVGPYAVQSENHLVAVPHGLGASGYRLVPASGWAMSAVKIGRFPCGCTSP